LFSKYNQSRSKPMLRSAHTHRLVSGEAIEVPFRHRRKRMRGPPVTEEQYQERFWRRRLDGIGLDTVTKEFRAIKFKRKKDASSNYAERATAVVIASMMMMSLFVLAETK